MTIYCCINNIYVASRDGYKSNSSGDKIVLSASLYESLNNAKNGINPVMENVEVVIPENTLTIYMDK